MRWVRLCVFSLLLLCLARTPGAGAATISAYCYPPSVAQGQTLNIYVSTDAPRYNVAIRRQGLVPQTVYFQGSLLGLSQPVPEGSWENGCNWTPSIAIRSVPTSWPSGVYVVELTGTGIASPGNAVFVVRENNPGSTANILFCSAVNTYQAYNHYGGKCLYDYLSTDGVRSPTVSFKRPYKNGSGKGQLAVWELPFILWMDREGYRAEYCTDVDLDANPALLDAYDLLVMVGHNEYWSRTMREAIHNRLGQGLSVAIFGGNTCWWQVRYSADRSRMICYKDAALDPMTGVDDAVVTVNWHSPPVNWPDTETIGVSSRFGGYHNNQGWFPDSLGYGDYRVERANHWVFRHTGLVQGDEFGGAATIVGYEVDGAVFNWSASDTPPLPMVVPVGGTPMDFLILATAPASQGTATLGVRTLPSGDALFNAATTDWSHGLAADPVVQQITRNVLDALVEDHQVAAPAPPPPVTALLAAPNPFHGLVRVSFAAPVDVRARLDVIDIRGRRVATLLDRVVSAGATEVPWAGYDDGGERVGAGVYFLRLTLGTEVFVTKVVRLR